MSGGIYLIHDNDAFIEMKEQPYNSEDVLQELLAKYPNLLAGDQMDSNEPRRWLLVTREMGLPSDKLEGSRWVVDHLFLDQDGIPTLVEVKQSNDTRLRREVVGQLLEYAANAMIYWSVERIIAEFEAGREEATQTAEEELMHFLGDNADPDTFWQQVRTNLQAGRIRLVFVADEIPREFRRIVEFLNQQMSPADVFAVEVKQFAGGEHRALVPRLIGAVERKQMARSRATKKWTEETFFQDLAMDNTEQVVATVRRLLAGLRAIEEVGIWWGEGIVTSSFVPWVAHRGSKYNLFRVVARGGRIELYFGSLKKRPPFDREELRRELKDRYNEIEGISITDNGIERYPSIPLDVLGKEGVLMEFLDLQRWTIEEIRKT